MLGIAIINGREPEMQIAVASGKGGTGKTLLATSLMRVLASHGPVLIDADVEEPNAGLILGIRPCTTQEIYRPVPAIDPDKCNYCGKCAEICNFNALVVMVNQVLVYNELCHSCGACAYLCPQDAITEIGHPIGQVELTNLGDNGILITGRLNIGEAQSPPMVKAVKSMHRSAELRIIDCPPGTTCSMIESIRNSDYCLLITEPTPFGMHDLELSLEAATMLGIPTGLVINRWQDDDYTIGEFSARTGVPILARIPFSSKLAQSYMKGKDPLEAMPALPFILSDIIKQIREALS